jgi:hypothetical protein
LISNPSGALISLEKFAILGVFGRFSAENGEIYYEKAPENDDFSHFQSENEGSQKSALFYVHGNANLADLYVLFLLKIVFFLL